MGVGEPVDLIEGVARGVDIFDCVSPTRLARHGNALTPDQAEAAIRVRINEVCEAILKNTAVFAEENEADFRAFILGCL